MQIAPKKPASANPIAIKVPTVGLVGISAIAALAASYFITNPEKMEAVMEDAMILIFDRKIGVLKDLLSLLDQVVKAGRPLCSS
jgi:chaperonin GroEL (HSP60 family)